MLKVPGGPLGEARGDSLGSAQIGEVVRALMGEEMAAERAQIAAASALPDDGTPVQHSQPVEGEVARPAKLPLPAPPLTPPPVRLAEISLQLALPAGVSVGSGLRKRRPSEDDTAEDSVAGTRDPTAPTGVSVHGRDTRPGGSEVGEPAEAPDTAVGDDVSDSAARSAAGFDIQIDPELGGDGDGDGDGDGAPAGSSSVSASSLKATAPQGVARLSALRQASGEDYSDQSVVEPSVVEVGPEPRRRVWLYALMGGLALAVVAAWALWPKTTRPVQAHDGSNAAGAGATVVAGAPPGGASAGSGGLGGAAALPSPVASPLPVVSPTAAPEASASPLVSPSPVVSPAASVSPSAAASPAPVASVSPSPVASARPSPSASVAPVASASPRASASPSASASPRPSSAPSPSPLARDPSPKPDRRPERSPTPIDREPSESPRASPSGPPGTFSIDSEPYATIYVDGKKVGDTPLYKLPLAPGKHKVRAVSAAGTQNFSIEVQPGQALPPRKLRFNAATP